MKQKTKASIHDIISARKRTKRQKKHAHGETECTNTVTDRYVHFLKDIEGNNLVCVDIALDLNGITAVKTNLHFRPFPNQPKKKD